MPKKPTPKKPTPKKWTFDEWFEDQHGPCPGGKFSTIDLNQRAVQLLKVSDAAVSLYKRRLSWEDKRTSAQYAWNIKDRQKRSSKK